MGRKWQVSDRNKFPFPFSFPNRKLRSRCRYRSDPYVNSLERRKELIRKIPGFGGYKSKSFQVSGKLGTTTLRDDRSERNCRKKQRGMLKNNENGVAWKSGKSGDFGERLGNDPRRGRRKIGEGGRWKEGGGGGALLDETGGSLLHPAGSYFLSSCERY